MLKLTSVVAGLIATSALAAGPDRNGISLDCASKLIYRCDGDYVGRYLLHVDRLRAAGERVVIMGWCGSACTLHLRNPRTCVLPGAQFGFHGATGGSEELQREYLKLYPVHVQKVITALGGLHDGVDLPVVPGDQLAPMCSRGL